MKENNNTTNTSTTGSMSIKVTVTPMQNQEGSLKANASIILNDVLADQDEGGCQRRSR